jgi:hypothetical protein
VVAQAAAHPVQVLEDGQLVVQLWAQQRLHLQRQAGQRQAGGTTHGLQALDRKSESGLRLLDKGKRRMREISTLTRLCEILHTDWICEACCVGRRHGQPVPE